MPWNNAEAIEGFMAEHGDEVAAILTEPIMGNTGVIPPNPGYLELLRDLTTTHGSVLIFDEVITGFRVALGGAQAKYGVTPDLTTMAKALGGGFPVSAVGGKRSLMESVADGSVLHAGTYNASTLATAAVVASLGDPVQARHLRSAVRGVGAAAAGDRPDPDRRRGRRAGPRRRADVPDLVLRDAGRRTTARRPRT